MIINRLWLIRAALACALASLAPAVAALNVAVLGSSNYATAIQNAGNTVTQLNVAQIEGGLPGYDVLMMGHSTTLTPAACTVIKAFLNAGKGIVTEWSDAYSVFSTTGPNLYYANGTQCALFTGQVDYGGFVGTDTPVTITDTSSPLVAGLPNPLMLSGGSEYFYTISGFNTAQWTVVATFNGNSTNNNPAIMAAAYNGAGIVVVAPFDYGDEVGSLPNADKLLQNLVAFAANGAVAPPPPPPPPVVAQIPVPALDRSALLVLALLLACLGAAVMPKRHSKRS